ncbi:flagellar hook-basal body complex protein FliE [Microvirga tunisiensis]|uniref:Flagellar hook-basal body complex protein FliE n=2 Tax=Pannonibacter tanglangensis TaxID=2750084 RepID=A0ABW9ZJ42_9HYPH|nr:MULTISPECIES: flagellar hook-basal body complex protein FliE [unclassified Pannonibacter]NBN64880.1 flagellar hook-basal body complex protein FliE [Pannonibacter sp. XCT-34]NBN79383.1 flagellar hook-basal body complex protein FliE [Pannonibacter sp. XCT-53]
MIDQISSLNSVSSDGILSGVSQTRYVGGPAPVGGAEATPGVSFSETMAQVSLDVVDRIKDGEAAAISGISGKASAQQVVEAVMAAEASLQTAIAIRDKVVSAYQEISRMTI